MTRRRVATAIADAVRRALDIVVAVVVLVVGSPVLEIGRAHV